MKAQKLPSGRWRARYVDHYEMVNGKRKVVMGSVTRDTERAAIKAAMELEGGGKRDSSLTIGDCIGQYISIKESVLSPSTVRSYRSLQRLAYNDISRLNPYEAGTAVLQAWVGKYASNHSPKAVRNADALLRASCAMFGKKLPPVTLPQRKPVDYYTPTDEDISSLVAAAAGDMKKAVLLAAFGTLRRGEICALKYSDIEGCTVHVRRSRVELQGGGTDIKQPKTPQSVRTVTLPQEVIDVLLMDPTGEYVVTITPTALTNAFEHLVKACRLPHFRFHDLRAYSASIRHAMGIPDQYIMREGGWKTDTVLKAIYRRTMQDKEAEFSAKMNTHFLQILSPVDTKVDMN